MAALQTMTRDLALAHRHRWPDRRVTLASRLILLLSARGLWALWMYRCTHALARRYDRPGAGRWRWHVALLLLTVPRWLVQVTTKCEIATTSWIDEGVAFSDQGQIIFGAEHTGSGTMIGTCVTVGGSVVRAGLPCIGRNVWIGRDCIISGGISIGDGATLLPGTVLTRSVPAGAILQGNPARVINGEITGDALHRVRRGGIASASPIALPG